MAEEEYRRVSFQYGIVFVRTRRFQSLMDRFGKTRVTRFGSWFLLYLLPIVVALGFYMFLTELGVLLSPRGAAVASYIRTISPLANLGLPGINPYIPVVDGWISLIIAMIIHEGAHGVIARNLGIPVKSSGLFFFLFIPLGAFVDLDETALKNAKASHAGRILAGGAGINLVAAVLSLLLLTALVGTMVPAASGTGIVNVGANTPASNAGIVPGDIITQINGHNITDLNQFLGPNTNFTAGQAINLTVYRDGRTMAVNYVVLACCDEIINTTTNQVIVKYPYIGVSQVTGSDLAATATQYASRSYLGAYLCIPTLPICQTHVPFSDALVQFYRSPLGPATYQLTNLLYWIFLLNFYLAIFNALPIFPLDGGQAFRVGVTALGRGKLSERTVMGITGVATFVVIALIASVVAGPWFL